MTSPFPGGPPLVRGVGPLCSHVLPSLVRRHRRRVRDSKSGLLGVLHAFCGGGGAYSVRSLFLGPCFRPVYIAASASMEYTTIPCYSAFCHVFYHYDRNNIVCFFFIHLFACLQVVVSETADLVLTSSKPQLLEQNRNKFQAAWQRELSCHYLHETVKL